jgi:hypothetical protein
VLLDAPRSFTGTWPHEFLISVTFSWFQPIKVLWLVIAKNQLIGIQK